MTEREREREVIREDRPVDREVIVDDRGPRRGGGGGVLVAIIAIILVLLLGWLLLNALGLMDGSADGGDAEVNVEQQDDTSGDAEGGTTGEGEGEGGTTGEDAEAEVEVDAEATTGG